MGDEPAGLLTIPVARTQTRYGGRPGSHLQQPPALRGTAIRDAIATIVAHSALPAQTSALRFSDYGIVTSVSH